MKIKIKQVDTNSFHILDENDVRIAIVGTEVDAQRYIENNKESILKRCYLNKRFR